MPGDLDKLQGTWSITSVEVDGQQMALPDFGGASVVIANDRFKSTGMGMDYEGVVTLQEKQKPKAFDLAFTAGLSGAPATWVSTSSTAIPGRCASRRAAAGGRRPS